MGESESLDRIKSILERATDLPRDARKQLLDEECGADAALRARVEELLGWHDDVGTFLPSQSPGGTVAEHSDLTGRSIGPYEVLRKIGSGGFGTVYLVRQQQPIQRIVALKLIRGEGSSAHVLARFEAERQLLAWMDHPNIAVVHDAGVTDSGDPYFVMEYVDGLPITTFADERKLSIEDRLRLFQQLCDAVQHAHQKGVIHRDLKPSNVLVAGGDKPFVKVIDFGVAKALGARFTEATFHTVEGTVLGTPEYMSPEQATVSALGMDTRSDVYSLGVILYELLVGTVPFDRRDEPEAGLLGLLQRIREKEPPRPSTRFASLGDTAVSVAAQRHSDRISLAKRVRGDLEWIVLKCLEKEPSRRYASAAMLAEDVGRHLSKQPILARPPSTAYQLQKLVARHRGVAALAVTLATAVVVFAIAVAFLYGRQRVEAAKATQVNEFLQEMLVSATPENARGEQVLVRDILDDAAHKVTTGQEGNLELQAAVLSTLLEAYSGLGLPAEALAIAHAQEKVWSRLRGPQSLEYASALRGLGGAYITAGHSDSAEVVLAQAKAIFDKHRHVPAAERAQLLYTAGVAAWDQSHYEEAEKLQRETIALYRTMDPSHEDNDLASAVNALAVTLEDRGQLEEAEKYQREALELHRKQSGDDHPDVMTNMSNLAILLRKQRKYAESESMYVATIALERKVLGNDHPNLASALSNYAVLLKSIRRFAEAESLYQESLSIRRRVLGNDHPGVSQTLNNLAALYASQSRSAEAEKYYAEALDIRLRAYGEEHRDVATTRHNLASLMLVQGQLAEAEKQERMALATRRKLVGDSHEDYFVSTQMLTQILLAQKRNADAREAIESCLARQGAAPDADQVGIAWSRNLLGQCILRQGNAAAADTLLVGTLDTLLGDAGVPRSRKAAALQAAVEATTKLGRKEEAAQLQARLDELSE